MIKIFSVTFCAVVALAGCASTTPGQQDQTRCNVSTIGGAVAGGAIGRQVGGGSGRNLATVAGALGGAAAGNQLGC